MSIVKIIVAYHKPWSDCKDDIYWPLQVGAYKAPVELGIDRDDKGDNISEKNPYYSEITALYYIWKNIQSDYKGLSHYRRFFCFKRQSLASKYLSKFLSSCARIAISCGKKARYTNQHYVFLPYDSFVHQIRSEERILISVLGHFSIVAPLPTEVSTTVREHFGRIIGEKPIQVLDKLMAHNPFSEEYNKTMSGFKYYSGNMSLMESGIFNSYCSFLFPLLEKHLSLLLDQTIKKDEYLRVSGYVAEILTSVFIGSQRKNCKVYETPIYYVDDYSKLCRVGRWLVKFGFFHPFLLRNIC